MPAVMSITHSDSPFESVSTAPFVDTHSFNPVNSTVRHEHRRQVERMVQTPILQSPVVPKDRYACLDPLYPRLDGIIRPQLACELLELYFTPSDGSCFGNASPYVITPVLRRESVLDTTCARPTTTALLATMIWASAQTASLPQLLLPGSRAELCDKLQILVFQLQHERDQDNWQKISGKRASLFHLCCSFKTTCCSADNIGPYFITRAFCAKDMGSGIELKLL